MPQMRSRREQVDAHRFITARMNQALVLANPDSVERPLRRIGVSVFASVMIMVLIFGGFAIAALIGKGNDRPMLNHIITEKGTGAIFVYRTQSGGDPTEEDPAKLWPVSNYTSALLLLQPYGDQEVPRQDLKPTSLVGFPKGYTVGIEGAPPSPPDPESLLQDELWHVCSSPPEDSSSLRLAQVMVAEDADLADPVPLDDEWLFAADPVDGVPYLLTNDRRFKITDEDFFDKLQLDQDDVMTVKKEVIEAITPGPDLRAEELEYFDEPSGVVVDGSELLYGKTVVEGSAYYILVKNDAGEPEFAKIGEVMQRLLQDQPTEIDSATLTQYGGQADYEPDQFPQRRVEDPRTLTGPRPAVCGVYDPGDQGDLTIGYYESAPKLLTDAAESISLDSAGRIQAPGSPVAQVVLPAGNAALVTAQQLPGRNIGSIVYLVDSLGYKYGLVDADTEAGTTQGLLGYGSVDPVGVPESILALIQDGVPLNPEEARKQLDPSGESQPPFDSGEDETSPEAEDGGE
ncbi:type VII secretion protein EccB [Glycomyces halotolerans]